MTTTPPPSGAQPAPAGVSRAFLRRAPDVIDVIGVLQVSSASEIRLQVERLFRTRRPICVLRVYLEATSGDRLPTIYALRFRRGDARPIAELLLVAADQRPLRGELVSTRQREEGSSDV